MPTIKFPTIPSIDLTRFDVNAIVPRQLRNVTLPKIDMPKVVVPEIDGDKVRETAKEVAYTAIGLGVLGFQKVQVRRREVTDQLATELPKVANEALVQAEKVVSKVVATVQARRGVDTTSAK